MSLAQPMLSLSFSHTGLRRYVLAMERTRASAGDEIACLSSLFHRKLLTSASEASLLERPDLRGSAPNFPNHRDRGLPGNVSSLASTMVAR